MGAIAEDESELSHWGIDPVPMDQRRLTALDLGVLWGDLGVGLLVIVAGALLVAPADQFGFGLSFPAALIAILLGSLIGCTLLGLGGRIGANEGLPTMVLLRRVLGTKGSWVPTALNVAQLIGWTAFELWAMALVAERLGERLFGFSAFPVWLVLFTLVVLALGLWGPVGVIKVWMEKFGVWVIGTMLLLLTAAVLGRVQMQTLGGSVSSSLLGIPMDIVIALPVSWIPLVADYNRFAISRRGSFRGTAVGYLIANIWMYSLGAMLVIGVPEVAASPEGIALGVLSLLGIGISGPLLLTGLLVGETDEAFADVYSCAVSLRNIWPKANNRLLVVGVTLLGAVLAARFTMLSYELFLFLLGSVFVPLLGVWFADYFVLKNTENTDISFRWPSFVGWLTGFAVYHWIAPTPVEWWTTFIGNIFGEPLSARLPWMGASLPAFAIAFLIHIGLRRIGVAARNREGMS